MSCQSVYQLKLDYEANPIDIEKESPERIAIREFVQNQAMYIFGMHQAEHILNAIVDGFFLFNLRKDKYMLKSKDELLQYCKDENVTLQEKLYFWDIFLYNQRPEFLSYDEHEYIRSCGDLDGYTPPPPPPSYERGPSGFIKPTLISNELAEFLGKAIGTEMARTEVSKEINAYIAAHGLQDRQNGRRINPDEKLRKLLRLSEGDELTYFNLQKYMKPHFIK
uniref:DM2 domain-containing protein n=1 Tax=viral metagenome TaxID=1070528 RepID=A0A6C0DL11_9ZZZZ